MNRKFLLLLLMSGCCEVQASDGRKGPHSGYTGVLGDPLASAALGFVVGARALWDGSGASTTAREGAVTPVEVEEEVDPKAQTLAMVQCVVDAYEQNKTLMVTVEPSVIKVKNVATGCVHAWTFPVYNKETFERFRIVLSAIQGATSGDAIKRYFHEIVRLSNELNGNPLDAAALRAVCVEVEQKITLNIEEREHEEAVKRNEVPSRLTSSSKKAIHGPLKDDAKAQKVQPTAVVIPEVVVFLPSGHLDSTANHTFGNDSVVSEVLSEPVLLNDDSVLIPDQGFVMPPSAEAVLADGVQAADVPVAFTIVRRSDFNFDHVVLEAVNERAVIDQPAAQGNPRLFSYDSGGRLLLMKEEGATEIPFAWKCEEEDQASIEKLCVFLNRYLLQPDKKLAKVMEDNFVWVKQQMGLDDPRLQKLMSLQSGLLLVEDGFESAAYGVVPGFPAARSEVPLSQPSVELEPEVAVKIAAKVPSKGPKVKALGKLDTLEKELMGNKETVIGDWFLKNRDRILSSQLFAHVNGNKIQFGSDEDNLVHHVPDLDSEEILFPLCSSLNAVVKAFRGIEE